MDDLVVRHAELEDIPHVAEMCHCLWPDASVEEHARDITSLLVGKAPGTIALAPSLWHISRKDGLWHSSKLDYIRTPTVVTLRTRSGTSRDVPGADLSPKKGRRSTHRRSRGLGSISRL